MNAKYAHVKYLIFWPVFGVLFMTVERFWIREQYFPMYCPLDDRIPFCEYFLIPYLFWFIYLVGIHIYAFFCDTKSFEKLMRFIIITYSITLMLYVLFPNCQELRPAGFERDNIFTDFMASFYEFDTNTNVCPSLHVVGAFAAMAAVMLAARIIKVSDKIFDCALIFIFLASPIGSILDLYRSFEPYDKIVHFISGILLTVFGLEIAKIILEKSGVKINRAFSSMLLFSAFLFSSSAAGIWEIFEFLMDNISGEGMQRGMVDTVTDMIAGNAGALCYVLWKKQVNRIKSVSSAAVS